MARPRDPRARARVCARVSAAVDLVYRVQTLRVVRIQSAGELAPEEKPCGMSRPRSWARSVASWERGEGEGERRQLNAKRQSQTIPDSDSTFF